MGKKEVVEVAEMKGGERGYENRRLVGGVGR